MNKEMFVKKVLDKVMDDVYSNNYHDVKTLAKDLFFDKFSIFDAVKYINYLFSQDLEISEERREKFFDSLDRKYKCIK